MRENLLFYGIEEGGEHENCERLIKQVCVDKLQMPEAETMLIDRAHRIGIRKPNKTRPTVAKFHYYGQKEAVKSKSYDRSEQLKQANLGIGMHWHQQIRDARKALYLIMQKEKQNGKHVRMARDKLYIDGILYKPTAQQQQNNGWRCHEGHLKTLSWKVNGLYRKLSDTDFIDSISKFDLIFLSEAWLSPKNNHNLDKQGFKSVHMFGIKAPGARKGRLSGVYLYTILNAMLTK